MDNKGNGFAFVDGSIDETFFWRPQKPRGTNA
jgi:hypothetical protein